MLPCKSLRSGFLKGATPGASFIDTIYLHNYILIIYISIKILNEFIDSPIVRKELADKFPDAFVKNEEIAFVNSQY